MGGFKPISGQSRIYLDNAATSFPKPPGVAKSMARFINETGANPGRGAYGASLESARIVLAAREALAKLFGSVSSRQIVFNKNATEAINLVLYGFLREGDEVVTTSMEHNATMRPLSYLAESRSITIHKLSANRDGTVDPAQFEAKVNSKTRLVIVNHASNVTGTIQALGAIRQAIGDTPMLVDAAQTAGVIPIDALADNIDFLAFTGHKSLLGPAGIGGLYIKPGLETEVQPFIRGGTGTRSEYEQQPEFLPDKYEGGTLNTPGVVGLVAGLEHLALAGLGSLRSREIALTTQLLEGLAQIPGVTTYGPRDASLRTPVVPFNIEGIESIEVSFRLDREHGIASRAGLHCAPSAHRTIGTFPGGTARLAPGHFTTQNDVDSAIQAVAEIARKA